jgi:YrbI family 3-deoxy-D-manno-octulosonate 8-phosphate phosphatase
MKITQKLIKKFANIQLVLTDVDGVLTDGGMYYSVKGEAMKKFNTRDSMGMELLYKVNIPTILITREKSEIVKKRAKKIKIHELKMGVMNKEKLFPKICSDFNLNPSQIVYIGDDVNDFKILKLAGLSTCPSDAVEKIQTNVDYICNAAGGKGAFREIADIILKSKNLY